MNITKWTDKQREIIKEYYPTAHKKDIMKRLRNKSWSAIQKEASRMNIQRTAPKGIPRTKPPKQYLGKNQLKKFLDETNLTIEQIAKKLRTEPDTVRKYIYKYGL